MNPTTRDSEALPGQEVTHPWISDPPHLPSSSTMTLIFCFVAVAVVCFLAGRRAGKLGL